MKVCGFWMWGCICAFAVTLLLGMALVWVNIEQVNIAYELTRLNGEMDSKDQLRDKLEVERNNLLASYRLILKAEKFGLHPPKSGQVRRLPEK